MLFIIGTNLMKLCSLRKVLNYLTLDLLFFKTIRSFASQKVRSSLVDSQRQVLIKSVEQTSVFATNIKTQLAFWEGKKLKLKRTIIFS